MNDVALRREPAMPGGLGLQHNYDNVALNSCARADSSFVLRESPALRADIKALHDPAQGRSLDRSRVRRADEHSGIRRRRRASGYLDSSVVSNASSLVVSQPARADIVPGSARGTQSGPQKLKACNDSIDVPELSPARPTASVSDTPEESSLRRKSPEASFRRRKRRIRSKPATVSSHSGEEVDVDVSNAASATDVQERMANSHDNIDVAEMPLTTPTTSARDMPEASFLMPKCRIFSTPPTVSLISGEAVDVDLTNAVSTTEARCLIASSLGLKPEQIKLLRTVVEESSSEQHAVICRLTQADRFILVAIAEGPLRVYARIRPINAREAVSGDRSVVERFGDTGLLHVTPEDDGQAPISERFDAVFAPGTHEDVFKECTDAITSAVDGGTGTIFSCGQKGSGKTYTMLGASDEGPGVIQRACRLIFDEVRKRPQSHHCVKCSVLELYFNQVLDLLGEDEDRLRTLLPVRWDSIRHRGVIEGLSEHACVDAESLIHLVESGHALREARDIQMDTDQVSRGHFIVIVKIQPTSVDVAEARIGKLIFCDLAFSERLTQLLKRSAVASEEAMEAIEVGKSLTALSDVVAAVCHGSTFIPYRKHALTKMLSGTLERNSKIVAIANFSPASSTSCEAAFTLSWMRRLGRVLGDRKNSRAAGRLPEDIVGRAKG